MNIQQESIQPAGCSTSELHSKNKPGFGERAMRAEGAAETIASPMVSSMSRDTHRMFREEWGFGASPELRAPQALALDAELGEQHPHVAGRGAAACPGHGCSGQDRTHWVSAGSRGNQVLLRCSSSPHPTNTNPETAFIGRQDNKVLGCSQLKVNNHLPLSTTQVLIS